MFLSLELTLLGPVPLLDIPGLGEGCILVVCSSLPTLGPLFRLAGGKVRILSGSGNDSRTISQGWRSNVTHRGLSSTSGRWDKLQGYQLDDEESTSSHASERIDDILLVYHGPDQIHKTLEFKVTTSAKGDRRAKPIDDRDTYLGVSVGASTSSRHLRAR